MIIAEKIIFNSVAFFLFIFMFFKMIRKNDTNYLTILVIQSLGILANFIEIISGNYENILLKLIMYLFSIILPIVILVLEERQINFSERFSIFKAKFYMLFKDNKDAKDILIKLVTKYPESYLGHKFLAEIYEKEGGMRKAIDEYVKAIDIKKNDYDLYYKIAFLLNELGKKEEASQMLENLLKKRPDYKAASNLFGDILISQEKYREAINIYMEALKYNQNDYDLYYNLGIAYTMLNDFKNAKICYEKAANINHEEYGAKYNLAQISLLYRDIETAEKYFTECLECEGLEPRAYFELAKIFMLKAEKDKAIIFVNKAIELDISMKKKADEEPIFIPIRMYIVVPEKEVEEKQVKRKISKKKLKVIEHLENTYGVVENLNLQELGKETKIKQMQKEIDKQIDLN